jgi:hypothetical protein
MKNTTSNAQINANRENAKFSTGPKSEDAKRKLKLNPLTHGFAGQTCFIPDHEKDAYCEHFKSFRAEYKPKGPTEQFLVQSLSELSWSSQQIRAVSTNLMALLGTKNCPRETGDDGLDFNLAQAANVGDHIKDINLLGIYEQRKVRLFNSTRNELLKLQADRKLAEKEELETASQIRKACKSAFQPGQREWQPSEDGFACSLEEIDRYIARNERLKSLAGGLKMAS